MNSVESPCHFARRDHARRLEEEDWTDEAPTEIAKTAINREAQAAKLAIENAPHCAPLTIAHVVASGFGSRGLRRRTIEIPRHSRIA